MTALKATSLPSTRALGAAGEQLAAAHLVAQGYRIVGTNLRFEGGELDVIAWDGGVLCFVEVRSRASALLGHPLETIDSNKQRRIARAAAAWLAANPQTGPCRFDAVGIVMGHAKPHQPQITLVRGAFVPTKVY